MRITAVLTNLALLCFAASACDTSTSAPIEAVSLSASFTQPGTTTWRNRTDFEAAWGKPLTLIDFNSKDDGSPIIDGQEFFDSITLFGVTFENTHIYSYAANPFRAAIVHAGTPQRAVLPAGTRAVGMHLQPDFYSSANTITLRTSDGAEYSIAHGGGYVNGDNSPPVFFGVTSETAINWIEITFTGGAPGVLILDDFEFAVVSNVAPLVELTGPAAITLGSDAQFTATFTDSDAGDTHQAYVDCGGGEVPAGTVVSRFQFTCPGDAVGTHTVRVRVTDGLLSGSAATAFNVQYQFTGFLRPVDNLPAVNSVRAGSSVPLKFSLGSNFGLGILGTDGVLSPVSAPAACDGTAGGAIIETSMAGESQLSYDSTTAQYTYVWKTDRSWTGCRILRLRLTDGTTHVALFSFR